MTKLDGHIRERLLAPNFWHLATVGPDGAPQVSPMWVDIEEDAGVEYVMVNTSVGRVKEENLRRNPSVSLSHIDTENPYDRAEIRGRVVRFVEGKLGGADRHARHRLCRKAVLPVRLERAPRTAHQHGRADLAGHHPGAGDQPL